MATYHGNVTSISPSGPETASAPVIRTIVLSDLHEALRRGWEDFKAVPSHAIILCIIYPVLGLVLARTVLGYSILPLLFPLAAGFALLGPFAAIGLYELSRRRERGEQPTAWDALEVLRSPSFGAMLGLGALLLALFVTWVATAQAIYIAAFGYEGASGISDFVTRVLTTPSGMVAHRRWLRRRLPVRPRRTLCQRGVVPDHAGSSRRRRRCDGDLAAGRGAKPRADGRLGIDRRRAAGGGIVAVLPRPCRRHSAARACDLASLSADDRTGTQSAAVAAPRAPRAQARCRFPGQPVPVAAEVAGGNTTSKTAGR